MPTPAPGGHEGDEPQPFRLQDLPPELRLQIYASVFEGATVTATVTKGGAQPGGGGGGGGGGGDAIRFAHSPHSHLLLACRAVRHEAHRVFWSAAVVRARSVTVVRAGGGGGGGGAGSEAEPAGGHHRRLVSDHAGLGDLAALFPREAARAVRHLRRVKVHARLAAANAGHLRRFPALRTISLLEGEDALVRRVPTAHLDGTPLAPLAPQTPPTRFEWHSWDGVWAERAFFRFRSWPAGAGVDGVDPREALAREYGIRCLLDGGTRLQCVGVDSFLKFPIGAYGYTQVSIWYNYNTGILVTQTRLDSCDDEAMFRRVTEEAQDVMAEVERTRAKGE